MFEEKLSLHSEIMLSIKSFNNNNSVFRQTLRSCKCQGKITEKDLFLTHLMQL